MDFLQYCKNKDMGYKMIIDIFNKWRPDITVIDFTEFPGAFFPEWKIYLRKIDEGIDFLTIIW